MLDNSCRPPGFVWMCWVSVFWWELCCQVNWDSERFPLVRGTISKLPPPRQGLWQVKPAKVTELGQRWLCCDTQQTWLKGLLSVSVKTGELVYDSYHWGVDFLAQLLFKRIVHVGNSECIRLQQVWRVGSRSIIVELRQADPTISAIMLWCQKTMAVRHGWIMQLNLA